ncbi:MAG: hypothetical protein KGL39_39490 [Patescibacteria group bacterium]|nr:hypothetical protein [Patescibacteria group bacterium]
MANPNTSGGSVSDFFRNMLTGAERGVVQAASGSTFGQQLQGLLTQGQSQLFAQNAFGNPMMLLAVIGLSIFAVFILIKKV